MKREVLSLVIMVIVCINISSCRNDDSEDPTLQEQVFDVLAGEWTLSESGGVILDGQDVSLNYRGFSLSFDDGSYITSNAGDLFNASGTWEFVDEEARLLRLDNALEIRIITLSESIFEFSFFSNGVGGAAAGIGGNYVITVGK